MSCEGCGIRFTLLRRKKCCKDCGLLFCSGCSTLNCKLHQCYRCKVFTSCPLVVEDLARLRLRDLQWFVDQKKIPVATNDLREKAILVDSIVRHSRGLLYPEVLRVINEDGNIRGLFGPQPLPPVEPTASHPPSGSIGNINPSAPLNANEKKSQLIDLRSVGSRSGILELTTIELKLLLTQNFISFRGCCEKRELQDKVCWLWDLKEAAANRNAIPDENLCKICMESPIDSLFLDCGHMVTCTVCGKQLHDCPICRQIILRVVKAFKS